MSKLHSPSDPRYARLFELLRQQDRAEHVAETRKHMHVRRLTAEEAKRLQNTAQHSLKATA